MTGRSKAVVWGGLPVAVLLATVLLAGCTAQAGSEPTSATSVTATSQPESLPVLLLDALEPDPESVARLFLGDAMTAEEIGPPDSRRVIYRRGDESVSVDPGELTYAAAEPHEPVTVSPGEAAEIAAAFLDGTIGLPPDAIGPTGAGATVLQELGSDAAGTAYSYTVEWTREIDGVPVAGAQWIRVEVAGEGAVSRVHRRWHRVSSAGEVVTVRAPGEIIDLAKGVKGGSCPECAEAPTAEEVAAARLVYHVPLAGDQGAMTPAWEVTASDGGTYYFHAGTGEALDW